MKNTGGTDMKRSIQIFLAALLAGTAGPRTLPAAADDAAAARWVTPAVARTFEVTDAVERCLTWAGL